MSVRGCLRTFIYLVSLPLGASFLYVHINPYIYIFVFPCPFLNFYFFLFFGHKIGTSKSGKFKLQQRNSKCNISLHRIVVPFGFCAFLKYLHAPFFPCSPHFFIFSQDFTSSLEAPVPRGQDLDPIFPAGKSPAASVSRLPAGL